MCKRENCDLKKFEDEELENSEYCILHCEKDEKNGWYSLKSDGSKDWDESKLELFWDEIKSEINKKTAIHKEFLKIFNKDNKNIIEEFKEYKFENIYFPLTIKYNKPFYELNRCLNESNKLNLYFENCHFLGKIDFHHIFKAKDINFDNCDFYEDLEFKKNTFDNLFVFEDCRVHKKAEFRNITFKDTTSFIKSTFFSDLNLIHTKFESLALFNGMKIDRLRIDNTFFKDEANFLNMKNKDDKELESKNIANKETARIIKHSFEKQDNIIKANKFYALEMQKQEEELKWNISDFGEKIIFKAHKLFSNHSQDWFLALLWIVFITLCFNYFSNILLSSFDEIIIPIIGLICILVVDNGSTHKEIFDIAKKSGVKL
ncbi:MAG: hypothetical protein U9N02_09355 [Campylobacterota bacterium]|nr:hypothetical protein [Campylobacterota bacterium]